MLRIVIPLIVIPFMLASMDFVFFVPLAIEEMSRTDFDSLYDAPQRAFFLMVFLLVPLSVIGLPSGLLSGWLAGMSIHSSISRKSKVFE